MGQAVHPREPVIDDYHRGAVESHQRRDLFVRVRVLGGALACDGDRSRCQTVVRVKKDDLPVADAVQRLLPPIGSRVSTLSRFQCRSGTSMAQL